MLPVSCAISWTQSSVKLRFAIVFSVAESHQSWGYILWWARISPFQRATWHCLNTWHNYEQVENSSSFAHSAQGFQVSNFWSNFHLFCVKKLDLSWICWNVVKRIALISSSSPEIQFSFEVAAEKQTKSHYSVLKWIALNSNPVFMSFGRNFR